MSRADRRRRRRVTVRFEKLERKRLRKEKTFEAALKREMLCVEWSGYR